MTTASSTLTGTPAVPIPIDRLVLDPTGELAPAGRERVARPRSLEGRTVGLLDISKPLGSVFLDTVERHLQSSGVTVVRFTKPTFAKPAPVDMRAEIARRCDAVIEALAD